MSGATMAQDIGLVPRQAISDAEKAVRLKSRPAASRLGWPPQRSAA